MSTMARPNWFEQARSRLFRKSEGGDLPVRDWVSTSAGDTQMPLALSMSPVRPRQV